MKIYFSNRNVESLYVEFSLSYARIREFLSRIIIPGKKTLHTRKTFTSDYQYPLYPKNNSQDLGYSILLLRRRARRKEGKGKEISVLNGKKKKKIIAVTLDASRRCTPITESRLTPLILS